MPKIVAAGGWVLSIGNEPAGFLEDQERSGEALARFLSAVREHVRSLDPRLAVTLTLTGLALLEEEPFAELLVAQMDVVSANYYCLNADLSIRRPLSETVPADVDQLLTASQDKPLVLQQLGCPSGWAEQPSVLGVSQADATEFFRLAYTLIAERPRARATFAFQLVDWSQQLTELLYGPLRDVPGLAGFVDRLFEWLRTTGFMTFDEPPVVKPSWQEFVAALPGV